MLDEKYFTAFRSMSVANNTVSFFSSIDASVTDSGVTFAPDVDVNEMLTEVFGA